MKVNKIFKNTLITFSLPVLTYLLFAFLCSVKGVNGFGVGSDLTVMLRTTIYTGLIALAVSYNLTSGRFDFSVGSVLILSTIIGVNTSLKMGFGPVMMLLVTVLVGMVLGAISGIVYVTLKLPPMVCSLGVAMIYEAFAFTYSKGSGVKLIGRTDLLIYSTQPYIYILGGIIVLILFIILNYTKFGFDTNSLRSGQEISVSVGVNEKRNSIICYIIAGALMAVAGIINVSILGTCTPKLGLASSAYMMNAFLPMFVGVALGKYSDRNIGIIMGAFTQAVITSGFGKLGLSTSLQSVLNAIIILVFLFVTTNSYKLVEMKMFKEKREQAKSIAS